MNDRHVQIEVLHEVTYTRMSFLSLNLEKICLSFTRQSSGLHRYGTVVALGN